MNRFFTRFLLAGILLTPGLCALAQDFPSKPIRMIANQPPGGLGDVLGRLLAPAMSKQLGQNVIVDSMSGAGGLIALEYIAKRALADGYSVVITSQLVTFPVFVKDLRFDPLRDLVAVSSLVEGSSLLAAPAVAPFNDYAQFVEYAKANPGKLNFGSSGLQSQTTLSLEAIKQKHGIDIANVPYQGAGQYMPALISNTIQLAFYGEFRAVADVRDKKIKVLAVSGERRVTAFPNVPTFVELGLPGIQNYWYALMVAAATPRNALERLNAATLSALQSPEVKGFTAKSGLYLTGASPEASMQRIINEATLIAGIAKKAGIQPQ